jgi:hypothetical protein
MSDPTTPGTSVPEDTSRANADTQTRPKVLVGSGEQRRPATPHIANLPKIDGAVT